MLRQLIKLAGSLDRLGLKKEADIIDSFLKKNAGPFSLLETPEGVEEGLQSYFDLPSTLNSDVESKSPVYNWQEMGKLPKQNKSQKVVTPQKKVVIPEEDNENKNLIDSWLEVEEPDWNNEEGIYAPYIEEDIEQSDLLNNSSIEPEIDKNELKKAIFNYINVYNLKDCEDFRSIDENSSKKDIEKAVMLACRKEYEDSSNCPWLFYILDIEWSYNNSSKMYMYKVPCLDIEANKSKYVKETWFLWFVSEKNGGVSIKLRNGDIAYLYGEI